MGYSSESVFVSAPLKNDRSFAGDRDVIVVMEHCTSVTFMGDGDISIVSKGAKAEERVV